MLALRSPGIVVFEQDAVLQGLMPALDLALGLGVIGGAADVIHALLLEPIGESAGDIGRAVITEQPWLVDDPCPVASPMPRGPA